MLVSRIRSPQHIGLLLFGNVKRALAEALDRGQNVVGGLGPAKGLRIGIGQLDVVHDCMFEVGVRVVGAALDLPLRQQRKKALDLIDP